MILWIVVLIFGTLYLLPQSDLPHEVEIATNEILRKMEWKDSNKVSSQGLNTLEYINSKEGEIPNKKMPVYKEEPIGMQPPHDSSRVPPNPDTIAQERLVALKMKEKFDKGFIAKSEEIKVPGVNPDTHPDLDLRAVLGPPHEISPKSQPEDNEPINILTNSQPKLKPFKILSTEDMWKLSVSEQREYLHSLHANETEPSTKAADEFIAYAKASLLTKPLSNPANIWNYPSLTYSESVGYGSPGAERVKYHIAGQDTEIPYGYPEESIFILTASYRDPEAASTIARAYARCYLIILLPSPLALTHHQ
jgi:hypothetical protein